MLGREVKFLVSGELTARLDGQSGGVSGFHEAVWDGRDELGTVVSAGVYLYQIRAGAFMQMRKMLLLN